MPFTAWPRATTQDLRIIASLWCAKRARSVRPHLHRGHQRWTVSNMSRTSSLPVRLRLPLFPEDKIRDELADGT